MFRVQHVLLGLLTAIVFRPWSDISCQDIVIDIDIPGIIVKDPKTEAVTSEMVTDDQTTIPNQVTTVSEEDTDSTMAGEDSIVTNVATESPIFEMNITTRESSSPSSVGVPPPFPEAGVSCVKDSMKGCNLTNLERCVYIRERALRCVCLTGYARGKDGYSCIAVDQYMVLLPTGVLFTPKLEDKSSREYRLLEFNARDTLIQLLQKSSLASIAMDAEVVDIRPTPDGSALIKFKLAVSREYAPTQDMVEEELKKGLEDVVNGGETNIDIGVDDIEKVQASAPDPCSDALLNHCDVTATCSRGRRGFLCTCPKDTTDISYNRGEAPGEICTDAPCECSNGGVCERNTVGDIICRCAPWFLGGQCGIDGKALLISLCCIVGVAVLVTCLLCGCYMSGACKRSRLEKGSNLVVPYSDYKRRPQNYYYRGYTNHISYQPRLLNYWQRPSNDLYTITRAGQTYDSWQWQPK